MLFSTSPLIITIIVVTISSFVMVLVVCIIIDVSTVLSCVNTNNVFLISMNFWQMSWSFLGVPLRDVYFLNSCTYTIRISRNKNSADNMFRNKQEIGQELLETTNP